MIKSTKQKAGNMEKEEMILSDRILETLMKSQAVQDAVDSIQAMVDTRERLHIDLNKYKTELQFLELSIENFESNPALISSAEDIEKYEGYNARLPVVNKSIKLLAKRLNSANSTVSIDRDISDLQSSLATKVATALLPIEEEMQNRVDELSEAFFAEILSISMAFTRASTKQKLIAPTLFPSIALRRARPRIQNLDELERYADTTFGTTTSTAIGSLKKDLDAAKSTANTKTGATPGGTPWQVAESAPRKEMVRPGGGNLGNPHVPTI